MLLMSVDDGMIRVASDSHVIVIPIMPNLDCANLLMSAHL